MRGITRSDDLKNRSFTIKVGMWPFQRDRLYTEVYDDKQSRWLDESGRSAGPKLEKQLMDKAEQEYLGEVHAELMDYLKSRPELNERCKALHANGAYGWSVMRDRHPLGAIMWVRELESQAAAEQGRGSSMDDVELIKADEVEMLGELWAANEINQLRVEIAELKAERSGRLEGRVQWWLASLDRYGNPSLRDGPHHDRTGVEKAMYLFERLNLGKREQYAAARIMILDVTPASHGADEDAIRTINDARQGAEKGAGQ